MLEYPPETSALANSDIKDEFESTDTSLPPFHPTPNFEEVKEVTVLQSSLQINIQTSAQHIPVAPHPNHP